MKKYLHILEQTSLNLTSTLIKMYNEDLLLRDYNTFYTKDKSIFDANKNQGNVCFNTDLVEVINSEYKNYDYIFIHAMNFSISELLKIKRDAKKKFIWLTWGHDLYGYDVNKFIMFLKQIKLRIRMLLIRNIYGFGYSFDYDAIQVHKLLPKKVETFHLPYGWAITEELFSDIDTNHTNESINVLIGHCGFSFVDHIKMMKQLKQIYSKNMTINLILSYGGSAKYINKVKKFAYDNFDRESINIIENKMSEKEYTRFLSTIDIAIFDYRHSSGLGNIYKLLYLGKKIYLNKKGILYKGMETYGKIPLFKTEDISKSYDEFSKMLTKKEKLECRKFASSYSSNKASIGLWKMFFDEN